MDRRTFIGAGVGLAAATTIPAASWKAAKFSISWGDGTRAVYGRVRGCWGIFKNFRPNVEGDGFTLAHLPTGLRAGSGVDQAVMVHLAGTLDRIADFQNETHESVKEKGLAPVVVLASKKSGLVHLGGSEWKAA